MYCTVESSLGELPEDAVLLSSSCRSRHPFKVLVAHLPSGYSFKADLAGFSYKKIILVVVTVFLDVFTLYFYVHNIGQHSKLFIPMGNSQYHLILIVIH